MRSALEDFLFGEKREISRIYLDKLCKSRKKKSEPLERHVNVNGVYESIKIIQTLINNK